MGAMPDDMIGAIKIKDGLFIGDEFAASVSAKILFHHLSRIRFDIVSFVEMSRGK